MRLLPGLPVALVSPERIEESEIDRTVDEVRRFLRAEEREKGIWIVPEEAFPPGLAARLQALGMAPNDLPGIEAREARMVAVTPPPVGPPGVMARRAEDLEEFRVAQLIAADSPEMDDKMRRAFEERPNSSAIRVRRRAIRDLRRTPRRASHRLRQSPLRAYGGVSRRCRHARGSARPRRLHGPRPGPLGSGRRARHPSAHCRGRCDVATDPRAPWIHHRRLVRLPARRPSVVGRVRALVSAVIPELLAQPRRFGSERRPPDPRMQPGPWRLARVCH